MINSVKENILPEQNTPEWLEWRKDKIGASDAPIIMGVSPYRTPHQLMLDKLGLSEKQPENWAMKNGKNREPEILAWFNANYNCDCKPKTFVSSEYPWMIASLDGYDDNVHWGIEIKTAGKADHELARRGQIPPKYIPQVQHQMKVTGLNFVYYVSENSGEKLVVVVDRDEEFIARMMEMELKFYDDMNNFVIPDCDEPQYKSKESPLFRAKLDYYFDLDEKEKYYSKEKENAKEEILNMCDGNNTKCGNYFITKSESRGAVDYSKIPQLQDVDLEQYRKKPVIKYSIKLKEENDTL